MGAEFSLQLSDVLWMVCAISLSLGLTSVALCFMLWWRSRGAGHRFNP